MRRSERRIATLTILLRFRYDECVLLGPVAQLGARMTGSHEVRGSNPLRSIYLQAVR